MRNLVLKLLVHLGIPKEISKRVKDRLDRLTYVFPSYSKMGSQPAIVSSYYLDFKA